MTVQRDLTGLLGQQLRPGRQQLVLPTPLLRLAYWNDASSVLAFVVGSGQTQHLSLIHPLELTLFPSALCPLLLAFWPVLPVSP